jgi:tRNA pseudouridine55 synthase
VGRRGAPTGLAGILPVDKPAGLTSHDVVAAVRRITGERRVGHAGTLDPMATGLLVVLIGPYTRLEPYLSAAEKGYEARIAFGTATDTDDAEGAVTATEPVPDGILDAERAQALLDTLHGDSMQMPPAFSAIKVAGRVAHRAARAGEPVALSPRPVTVYESRLIAVDPAARTWNVAFTVSKGTYVRALARDLGRAAGTVAHLTALRRTASGPLRVERAHSLDEVEVAGGRGTLPDLFTDPIQALGLPTVEATLAGVADGKRLPRALASDLPAGTPIAVTCKGRLIAVYRAADEALAAAVVLPGAAA